MSGVKKGGGKKGGRQGLTVRVKTAKGRRSSSTKWLKRQLNDPYVEKAVKDGYRSRAVYKLREIDDKFDIIKKSKIIMDLGCAPGGWLQLCKERAPNAEIIGIDILEVEPMGGVEIICGDIEDPDILDKYEEKKLDLVLSDMAANTTGHKDTDHLRIIALCEIALDFALHTLNKGGSFACKIFQGGGTNELVHLLKMNFDQVKFFKPESSRKDSSEAYLVAVGKK